MPGTGLVSLRLAPPPFTEATKVNGMEVEEEVWGSAAPRDPQVNVTRKVCEVRACYGADRILVRGN